MTTKIIAFSGKKQSGKSTCSNFIYANYLSVLSGFESCGINAKGLIEAKISDTVNTIDVFDYYHNLPTIDSNIAEYIKAMNPFIKIYSFAYILKKQICIDILGLEYNQCYGSDEDKNTITHLSQHGENLSAREVMQIVGTDFFRSIYTDIWPYSTLQKIKKEAPKIAIINDCRFPNEVDFIKNHGGIVVRLTRSLYNDTEHPSESILDKNNYDWSNFNYIIDNANLDIYEQCLQIMDILKKESINTK